jgi:PAS domain S-box-containing protein
MITPDLSPRDQRTFEMRYRRLFEAARDGILILDAVTLKITDVNPFMLELLGFPSDWVLNKELWEIGFFADKEASKAAFVELQRAGYLRYDDLPLRSSNGVIREVEFISSVYEENGVPIIQCNIRDITEQKQIEKTRSAIEQNYQTLFEHAPDGILIADAESYYLDANAVMCSMLGYTRDELIGLHASDIVVPEEVSQIDKALELIDSGSGYNREWKFRRKDGTSFTGEVMVTVMPESNLMAVIRDTTERRRVDNERRIIFEIISGSITTTKLDDFFKLVHRSISQVVYAENCFVMLHDPSTDMVSFEFWVDRRDPKPAPKRRGKGFARYAMDQGVPLLLSKADSKILRDRGEAEQIGSVSASWLGVPLRTPSRSLGVLVLQHYEDENAYNPHDLEFLSFIGDQIALAIERKLAQEALGESEERYRSVVETASDAIITIDEESTILFVNSAAEKIFGYTVAELTGSPLTMLMPANLVDRHNAGVERYKQTGQKHVRWDYLELPGMHRSGQEIPLSLSFSEFTLRGRHYFTGIISDLTARKLSAAALRESEERYRDMVQNAIDIIYTHDLQGNYTSVNRAAERILGYTEEECITMNMAQVVAPEYLEEAGRMIAAKLAGEDTGPYDLEVIVAGGSRVALEINTRVIYENGIAVSIQGIARDITERKRADDALRESDEKFNDLADNITDAFWVRSPDMRELQYVSPAFEDIWGRSVESLYADPHLWVDFILPEDRERVVSAFGGLTGDKPSLDIEYRIVRPDGTIRWIRGRGFQVRNDAGELIRNVGIITDISARRRAEMALAVAEEKYRSLFENAVGGIFQSTPEGTFISANPAMARILGFESPEELIGLRRDIGSQHYVEKNCRKELEELLEEHGVVIGFECEVYRRDLSRIWTQENIRVVRDADGRVIRYEGSIEDITERKHLEDKFRQSQKMEAIGLLAGGVAHDFNNLLTAILGYSDLTLRKLRTDDPLSANVKEIRNAGERAAALTNQLLAFSRKQILEPRVHNLNKVIAEIEKMLRRIIRESIEFQTILDPRLGNIKADPGQIEQVIMNLAVNARDAMPNGGRFTIETQNECLDKSPARGHIALKPGSYIKMTVSDTGQGMAPEIRRRIFEPFFTTKGPGKGTGLGLSTVHGIVTQSGGDITVESEIGKGTSFVIYLPRVDEPAKAAMWVNETEEDSSGTGTILLVEDEELVRSLVRTILTGIGYKVLEAASGKAALAICESYTDPIDLLLTDMVMPGMGGSELGTRVAGLRPEIKTLFMSGYTEEAIIHSGSVNTGVAFIEKPFTLDSLARKVREVILS